MFEVEDTPQSFIPKVQTGLTIRKDDEKYHTDFVYVQLYLGEKQKDIGWAIHKMALTLELQSGM
jgi:hypothetical protein